MLRSNPVVGTRRLLYPTSSANARKVLQSFSTTLLPTYEYFDCGNQSLINKKWSILSKKLGSGKSKKSKLAQKGT